MAGSAHRHLCNVHGCFLSNDGQRLILGTVQIFDQVGIKLPPKSVPIAGLEWSVEQFIKTKTPSSITPASTGATEMPRKKAAPKKRQSKTRPGRDPEDRFVHQSDSKAIREKMLGGLLIRSEGSSGSFKTSVRPSSRRGAALMASKSNL
jgi:hypothetical protein